MLEIPLLYKDRRLEGETTLRQCQLVQLHLLYVFDAICKEYNLTYFLGGGTLLGAMRHGGFIPWDDDLDVGMPRKDYEKFLKIAPSLLPKDVRLQTLKSNPHIPMFYAKLRDAYSFYFETSDFLTTKDNLGIFIDIFPYDEVPNISLRLKQLLFKASYHSQWRAIEFKNKMKKSFLNAWYFSFKYLFWNVITHILPSVISIFNKCFTPKTFTLGFNFPLTTEFKIRDVVPIKECRFEDGDFPAPNNPEAFLESQYGNWREIPPPEKRPRHATIILPTQSPYVSWAMKYPYESF